MLLGLVYCEHCAEGGLFLEGVQTDMVLIILCELPLFAFCRASVGVLRFRGGRQVAEEDTGSIVDPAKRAGADYVPPASGGLAFPCARVQASLRTRPKEEQGTSSTCKK